MSEEQCSNCKFFKHRSKEQQVPATGGQCRRYPPLKGKDKWNNVAEWPWVDETDYCGEYKA